ncbi:helix-turn-helix domain-containing protein [Rhizobium sp. SL86]|uniref:helix-turn-helix domain-containing protein n=1 Tax=Rhizobium sp. SL86 TaxID=2995148 RepID=UPI0022726279|nr:XRE family transcriptional regulator [Rhizobium sp. SL86]MCY1667823.1 XRE family transcriptional regulator [Rhizobium sp. SL86]
MTVVQSSGTKDTAHLIEDVAGDKDSTIIKLKGRPPADGMPAEFRVGSKLRHARLLQGHTLKELADIIGCSESMLSKLENEKLMPSISFLHRLASALGTSIAELFAEFEADEGPAHHFPSERRARIEDRGAGRQGAWFERILPVVRSGLLQALILNIPAGVRSDNDVEHIGEEVGYLIEGELNVTVDGRCYSLKQGDLLFFSSSLPHGYHNVSDKVARILWVNTPPSL